MKKQNDLHVVIPHIVDPFSPQQGGGRRFFVNYSKYLINTGREVTFLGLHLKEYDKIKIHYNFHFVPVLSGSSEWFFYVFKLYLTVPFLKIPDDVVIHTVGWEYMLPFVIFHRKTIKVFTSDEPLSWIILNYPKTSRIIIPLYNFLVTALIRKIDALFVDQRNINYYIKKYPNLRNKFVPMDTAGVDTDLFKPLNQQEMRKKYRLNEEDKIVIFVGRLEKRKNVEFLIRSFKIVKEKIVHCKLIIVGDGKDITDYKILVDALSLKNDVLFFGTRPPDEIPNLLNCADVFALSSVTEGTPTVIREALSCGLPIVSTDVGDVSRVVGDSNIGKIIRGDETEYAEGLISFLIMNIERKKQVQLECLKKSYNFSLDNVYGILVKWIKVIKKNHIHK